MSYIKPGSSESGFFIEILTENPEDFVFTCFSVCGLVDICFIPTADRAYLPLKQNMIRIDREEIKTLNRTYHITTRERRLLLAFLKQKDLFLHKEEIRKILAIKDEQSLISRLRTKLRGVTSHTTGFLINIVSIKGCGYYMELIVDNLWTTL